MLEEELRKLREECPEGSGLQGFGFRLFGICVGAFARWSFTAVRLFIGLLLCFWVAGVAVWHSWALRALASFLGVVGFHPSALQDWRAAAF